jgi:SNF2 family DNA or RNA helicase
MDELTERKILNVTQIHGKQTGKSTRDDGIDAFQSTVNHVCVAPSQAGGSGVNLHDVLQQRQRVAFISPSFSSVQMLQCLGRIHRDGGTACIQTFVLAAGTLEEKVYRSLRRKLGNIKTLNDGDLI